MSRRYEYRHPDSLSTNGNIMFNNQRNEGIIIIGANYSEHKPSISDAFLREKSRISETNIDVTQHQLPSFPQLFLYPPPPLSSSTQPIASTQFFLELWISQRRNHVPFPLYSILIARCSNIKHRPRSLYLLSDGASQIFYISECRDSKISFSLSGIEQTSSRRCILIRRVS